MSVRITWKRMVAALGALILLALGAGFTGLVPIAASSGHWAVTDWYLHFTMRNAVRTRAFFTAPAEPTDPTGLISAAGHFDNACADCHGAPGRTPLPVMQAMTPPAPDLAETARHYSDAELFWIVRHGVKFTAMPAWPTQERVDEVRRMTALIARLPEMRKADYRALVDPPAGGGPDAIAGCAGCHGWDGMGRGAPDIPVIAGQDERYIVKALADYRGGTRDSAVMAQVAARMTREEMTQTARIYSAMQGLEPLTAEARPGAEPDGRAREIVFAGLPEKQLPACLSCHAEDKARLHPRLAGQKASYIAQRLIHMQGDSHVVDRDKKQAAMPAIARRIPKEEVEPLARWWQDAGGE